MATFDQLAARVRQELLGYVASQESVSELASSMTASDTAFQVDAETVENLSRGLVEIDDELILVKTYDRSSGNVVVMGLTNGRGVEGTTAATHSANALVRSAPAFPRTRVKEAVNQAIRGLYPSLVVFDSTEITRVSVVYEYELPSDVDEVWYVTGQLIGPTKVWQPLPNWRYNPDANPDDFPSGKSLQQLDGVVPGQSIRVVYAKRPTTLSSGSDDFATVTGYPERLEDLVVWGACSRLLPGMDAARLQMQAVESSDRADKVPPASAAKAVGLYSALYAERLEQERARQFQEIPNFAYFQGS